MLDHGCNEQQSFLCLRGDETTNNEFEKRSNDVIESCVYERVAIGGYHLEHIRGIFSYCFIKLVVYIIFTIYIISKLDPCEKQVCKGINAICQVVFETGEPFCACPDGMRGDPNVRCGKFESKILSTVSRYILLL